MNQEPSVAEKLRVLGVEGGGADEGGEWAAEEGMGRLGKLV